MTAGPSLWPCNFHKVKYLSNPANLVKACAVHMGVFDMLKMIASLLLLLSSSNNTVFSDFSIYYRCKIPEKPRAVNRLNHFLTV